MKTISIDHYGLDNAEKTFLSKDCPTGTTSFTVKNNRGFAADDYIIIGKPGSEKTEQFKIISVSGVDTIVTTASTQAHNSQDPIYRTKYNQVKIYSSSSATGTYTLLDTIDIEWDQKFTSYQDDSGTSDTYYKWKFYNETSTAITDYSHVTPGGGFNRNSVKVMTDAVLKEGGDIKEEITDREEVLEWFNQAQDDIEGRLNKFWAYDFLSEETPLSTTASTETISWPDDYDKIDHINYAFDDGTTDTTYRLRQISIPEFEYITQDDDASESDSLQKFAIDSDTEVFRFYPVPESSGLVLGLHYFKDMPELDDDADETLIPDHRLLILYGLEKLYRKRGEKFDRRADRYKNDYEVGIQNLIKKHKVRAGTKSPNLIKYVYNNERRWYKY